MNQAKVTADKRLLHYRNNSSIGQYKTSSSRNKNTERNIRVMKPNVKTKKTFDAVAFTRKDETKFPKKLKE